MPFPLSKLSRLLNAIDRNGDFHTSGTIEVFMPRLVVDGVGPVSFPLTKEQSIQLLSVAEQAPYGRGGETLVDTAVRNTRQIPPGKIRIEGRHWPETLNNIVLQSAEGLGVTGPVMADFYKLLVYDTGGFFLDHRDTEKVPGMFATLVIDLPSPYAGGNLIVRHKGKESWIDLHTTDPSEISFAAFYADCVHEVEPVTSGCRLTLVYNLRRLGTGQPPTPPDYAMETDEAEQLLKEWIQGKELSDCDSPEKIVYPLEHAYTPAEFSFESLKGSDAAVASVLTSAAKKTGCDLYLALLTVQESGSATYKPFYRSRWRYDHDGDWASFEEDKLMNRALFLSDWQHPEGKPFEIDRLPFDETELCPEDALENLEGVEESFQEATGNEGASFERTYRSAALVLWPRHREMTVINRAGLSVTLPYLEKLISKWQNAESGQRSSLWKQAEALSVLMIDTWPAPEQVSRWRSEARLTAGMINLLVCLGNEDHIEAFIERNMLHPVYDRKDNEALISSSRVLSSFRFAGLMTELIAQNAEFSLVACVNLLDLWVISARNKGPITSLLPSAEILVEVLTRKDPTFMNGEKTDFIISLSMALDRIDPSLSIRSVKHILSASRTYGLDEALIPAILILSQSPNSKDSPSFAILRTHCLDQLRDRISNPLEPPKDWKRPARISCKCADCCTLGEFLADPDRSVWSFKAAEDARNHVSMSIQNSRCDLDQTTEKKSRPYSLVCTKNSATYEKLLKQRKKDLETIAKLESS
ncbi:MAG: 2OG-Fe(II) oxygenase [Leptospirales bacterium]